MNYATLADDGLVLCKDGSLLGGFLYRGPDTASATPAELNYTTSRINAALARLGTGYALWVDSVRLHAVSYPEPDASHFPDAVTAAIEAERRGQFLSEGAHFETEYAFVISYMPPLRRNDKLTELIYDDLPGAETQSPGDRQIAVFKRALDEIEDGMSDILRLKRMRSYRFRDGLGHVSSARRTRQLSELRRHWLPYAFERAALCDVPRRLAWGAGTLYRRHAQNGPAFYRGGRD